MSSDPTDSDDAGGEPRRTDDGDRARMLSADWVREQRDEATASAAGAGLQYGLTIGVFALIGIWLDGKLGTSPWLLVAGVVLAVVGGTISLLKKFS
ncbi:MAG: AtpZ/AtpI family protein [Planctomycetota bacterium]